MAMKITTLLAAISHWTYERGNLNARLLIPLGSGRCNACSHHTEIQLEAFVFVINFTLMRHLTDKIQVRRRGTNEIISHFSAL